MPAPGRREQRVAGWCFATYVKRDVYGKVIEEIEDASDHHMIPCTAAFSPDGFFAVGYKNGGIVLYRKYKTYNTGNFLHLPLHMGQLYLHNQQYLTSMTVLTVYNIKGFDQGYPAFSPTAILDPLPVPDDQTDSFH